MNQKFVPVCFDRPKSGCQIPYIFKVLVGQQASIKEFTDGIRLW